MSHANDLKSYTYGGGRRDTSLTNLICDTQFISCLTLSFCRWKRHRSSHISFSPLFALKPSSLSAKDGSAVTMAESPALQSASSARSQPVWLSTSLKENLPSFIDLVRQLFASSFPHGFHHLQHGQTLASTEIVHAIALSYLSLQRGQREHMTFCEVHDMYVDPDTRAVTAVRASHPQVTTPQQLTEWGSRSRTL